MWGGAERGLGEAQVSVAGISEELHWIFRAALGSYGKGHWPQLNSSISSSILIRKAQWFANSSQSFIRIKYCSLNDIYYYSANFFFFLILLVLLYSGYFLGQTVSSWGFRGAA